MSDWPCLICKRPQDDPLHAPERGGLAHDVTPRIEQHAYDPGERRQAIRRMADREQLLAERVYGTATTREQRRADRRKE